MDTDTIVPADKPPIFNYVLSFLLVGVAWGFTTPFIRRAAADFNARQEAKQNQSQHGTPLNQSEGSRQEAKREGGREGEGQGWLKAKLSTLIWTIINLLRTPAYSIPLVVNLTGSVWFFLLVGQHGSFSLPGLPCLPPIQHQAQPYFKSLYQANSTRTLPNSPPRQQQRIPLHRAGRMVRGEKGDSKGNMDRDDSCSCGDWHLCAV